MFQRPGITELRALLTGDMVTALGLPTLLRRSPLRAIASALAGALHGVYGYLDWIARQAVPSTATGGYLESWAGLVGISRKPATAFTCLAATAGAPDAAVPTGTVFRSPDGGQYVVTTETRLGVNGSALVPVIAATRGVAGNLANNTALLLASPLLEVQPRAAVTAGVAGDDVEPDDRFRTRMLLRWASPPQGGAAEDYLAWCLAVPGVTRAWARPNGFGAGTVVVYTMWDSARTDHGGFPQGSDGGATREGRAEHAAGDQLAVANAIYPLRPVTALVISCAPVPSEIGFHLLTRVAVPDTVRAAVRTVIDAVFLAYADPLGGTMELSPFEVAIDAVPGMPRFTLTSPIVEIKREVGVLPVRGAVEFQATA